MKTIKNALLILSIASFTTACFDFQDTVTKLDDCKELSGVFEVQERDLADYDQVHISGVADVNLYNGPFQPIHIEADKAIMPYITTTVTNGVLRIRIEECFNNDENDDFPAPTFDITLPQLSALKIQGVGIVQGKDQFLGEKLTLDLEGVTKTNLDIDYEELEVDIEGLALAELSGNAIEQSVDAEGLSKYHAFDLKSESCVLEIEGSGNAEIHAESLLDVRIKGLARVCYKGNPTIKSDIGLTGTLSDCN